ncbi:IS66-like element accessory protein TnpA [Bradyrhizobium barranii]|uniref:IS66-like element accessory protein TnpA n=1 Tax=Bradyrhizobium TaxID=374 RepID=UPI003F220198
MVEVITESGRRRQFSADDKARFVEETLAPGAVVSEVARRHGLSPQQLFTWRRQMRQPAAIPVAPEPQTFVPAVVTPSSTPPERSPRQRRRLRKALEGAENSSTCSRSHPTWHRSAIVMSSKDLCTAHSDGNHGMKGVSRQRFTNPPKISSE